LEEVARATVFVANVEGIRRQQPLHEGREVRPWRPHEEVEMVVHEDVDVEDHARQLQVVRQLPKEALAVVVGPKDVRAPIAATGDMIHGVGKVNAWWSRHEERVP